MAPLLWLFPHHRAASRAAPGSAAQARSPFCITSQFPVPCPTGAFLTHTASRGASAPPCISSHEDTPRETHSVGAGQFPLIIISWQGCLLLCHCWWCALYPSPPGFLRALPYVRNYWKPPVYSEHIRILFVFDSQ